MFSRKKVLFKALFKCSLEKSSFQGSFQMLSRKKVGEIVGNSSVCCSKCFLNCVKRKKWITPAQVSGQALLAKSLNEKFINNTSYYFYVCKSDNLWEMWSTVCRLLSVTMHCNDGQKMIHFICIQSTWGQKSHKSKLPPWAHHLQS